MRLRRRNDKAFHCAACGEFDVGLIEIVFDDENLPLIRFCDKDLRTLHHLLQDHAPEDSHRGVWP